MEHGRATILHGQAVARPKPVTLFAHSDLHLSFEHPNLLMHGRLPLRVLKRYPGARREMHLDDTHRLRDTRRRDVAANVARGRVPPLSLVFPPGDRARVGGVSRKVEERDQGHAQSRREPLEHHRGRACLSPLDERDHRTTHPALGGECLERETVRVAQAADAGGDSLVQVGRKFFHIGRTIQHIGYRVKWTLEDRHGIRRRNRDNHPRISPRAGSLALAYTATASILACRAWTHAKRTSGPRLRSSS